MQKEYLKSLDMNKIKATLKKIKSIKNLNLLEFDCFDQTIIVLTLNLNFELNTGDEVLLYIKPSKLFLSTQSCNFENRLKVKVEKIEKGEILANIVCDYYGYKLEVLMLKDFINFENEAYLYFKSSDVSILKG